MTHLKLNRPLVFFDLETTGVDVGKDRIVEISMVKVYPDGKDETRTYIINPTVPIPEFASAIHGFYDKDVADKPTFAQVAHEINQFLQHSDLAGYNAIKFDIPLLVEEFFRVDIEFDLKNRRFIDVQNIFHKMEPRNLKAAYKFYCDANLENAHSAEADARATYEILKQQIIRYENTVVQDKTGKETVPVVNDVKSLSEFSYQHKNADLVGHLIFNEKNQEVFNFGKYKGQSVEEVFQKEPSYYDWMIKSAFPLSTKHVISQIRMRSFNKGSVLVQKK